jgi:hypothetical protein
MTEHAPALQQAPAPAQAKGLADIAAEHDVRTEKYTLPAPKGHPAKVVMEQLPGGVQHGWRGEADEAGLLHEGTLA